MKDSQLDTLASRVFSKRTELGLTKVQLAKCSGVTHATITHIESGETKKPRGLNELAAALGTSADFLQTGKYDKKSLLSGANITVSTDLIDSTRNRVQSIMDEVMPDDCSLKLKQLLSIADEVIDITVVLLEHNQSISNEAVATIIYNKMKQAN